MINFGVIEETVMLSWRNHLPN